MGNRNQHRRAGQAVGRAVQQVLGECRTASDGALLLGAADEERIREAGQAAADAGWPGRYLVTITMEGESLQVGVQPTAGAS